MFHACLIFSSQIVSVPYAISLAYSITICKRIIAWYLNKNGCKNGEGK